MIHPDIAALDFLVGRWTGQGHGAYPSIGDFEYQEEVQVIALPKPVLAYTQRTQRVPGGQPLHAEAGYFRLPMGIPELVIAQPTGVVEVHTGTLTGTRLVLTSQAVATTPSAAIHGIQQVQRIVEVEDDTMRYQLSMAAVGHPLQVHLTAELHRAEP
ncbi:MAG: FABP family protein [Euzebya sp.]